MSQHRAYLDWLVCPTDPVDGLKARVLSGLPAADSPGLLVRIVSQPSSGGGLTDAELRAFPVDVDTGLVQALTDAQLRAAAVPVSGPLTDAQLRAVAVPVSGPLTDTQLRAAAVPISAAVLPTAGGKTPTYVPVAQGAPGTTVLAAASPGNKHKLLGCVLTLSADGTIKFSDTDGDLSGAMDIKASGGFVLPAGGFPFTQTTLVNKALNLVTVGGSAKGVAIILTEA